MRGWLRAGGCRRTRRCVSNPSSQSAGGRRVLWFESSRRSAVEHHDLHAEAPDGGWPLIKLLNLEFAASELYKQSSSEDFLPSLGPQFASPEQLLNGTLDFRSEIYSLGATMSFLDRNVPLPRNWAAIYGGMRTAPETSISATSRRAFCCGACYTKIPRNGRRTPLPWKRR